MKILSIGNAWPDREASKQAYAGNSAAIEESTIHECVKSSTVDGILLDAWFAIAKIYPTERFDVRSDREEVSPEASGRMGNVKTN